MIDGIMFTPYMLFTTVLILSVFMLLFVLVTSFDTATKIPIGVVYASIAIVGLRLAVPIEIKKLSIEIGSKTIMAAINNLWRYKISVFGFGTLTVSGVLYIIWGVVAAVLLLTYIRKQVLFHRSIDEIPEIYDKQVDEQLRLIYSRFGFKFIPRVIKCSRNLSSGETGYFDQTIIIGNCDYTDEELYYILLHEMAHFYLKNNVARLCVEILRIVFWWNPIIYLFERHFKNLMETYADKVVANGLSPEGKLGYLNCLLHIYKTTDTVTSNFVNPISGNFSRSFLKNRFKGITKDKKYNVPISASIIATTLLYCALTVFFVFQPAYDPPEDDLAPVTDISVDNSCIVKDGDFYVLYYKGEPLISSKNRADVEAFFHDN